jgi:hypothetical protein
MIFNLRRFLSTFAVVVAACVVAVTSTNDVKRVDIYTADCEDCGMSVLGHLSIKV